MREGVKEATLLLDALCAVVIERLGPEGRLRVLNTMLKECGFHELPAICEETGRPTMAAEEYYLALRTVIEHAIQTM